MFLIEKVRVKRPHLAIIRRRLEAVFHLGFIEPYESEVGFKAERCFLPSIARPVIKTIIRQESSFMERIDEGSEIDVDLDSKSIASEQLNFPNKQVDERPFQVQPQLAHSTMSSCSEDVMV
jgi:hypothetical protein